MKMKTMEVYNKSLGWITKERGDYPEAEIMPITPEEADEFLERNTKNRSLSKNYLAQLSTDIHDDNWFVINSGIGFDWDGNLMDGQTRLHAIRKTGKEAPILVMFGMDPKAAVAIDGGRKRTEKNIASILHGEPASGEALSMLGFYLQMHRHGLRSILSRNQKMEFYDNTKEYSDFVIALRKKYGHTKSITVGPVLAAIFAAKASGKVHDSHLEDFCRVLFTGASKTDREAIIIPMRNYLFKYGSGAGVQRVNNFLLTQRYLENYIDNNPVSQNRVPKKMIYKVPADLVPTEAV